MADVLTLSDAAISLLRLLLAGRPLVRRGPEPESLPGRSVEETRDAYRELVRAGLMDPVSSFAGGPGRITSRRGRRTSGGRERLNAGSDPSHPRPCARREECRSGQASPCARLMQSDRRSDRRDARSLTGDGADARAQREDEAGRGHTHACGRIGDSPGPDPDRLKARLLGCGQRRGIDSEPPRELANLGPQRVERQRLADLRAGNRRLVGRAELREPVATGPFLGPLLDRA